MGFFSIDGPFYKFGSLLADVMILSILWLICSIPIFTIGSSTTAVFYVMTRRVSDHEGYLIRDFFKSFKQNFVQSTLSWLIIMIFATIIGINLFNLRFMGNMRNLVFVVQLCVLFEVTLLGLYIFPIISRFELKFAEAFKSAFFMANKHIFTSLSCLFLALGTAYLTYVYVIYVAIAMGLYAFITSYMFMRIFKKYRPEIDERVIEKY